MKHSFTLLLALFIIVPMSAQSDWFIKFGQTREEVKQYLSEKDYPLEVREDRGMHRLLASMEEGKKVEYVFDNGSLYATSVSRRYAHKKEAKGILKGCLDYMELISSEKIEQTSIGDAVCYTAVTPSRVIKLFVIDHPQKSQTLQLTSFSRLHGPMKDARRHYELDLLSRYSSK